MGQVCSKKNSSEDIRIKPYDFDEQPVERVRTSKEFDNHAVEIIRKSNELEKPFTRSIPSFREFLCFRDTISLKEDFSESQKTNDCSRIMPEILKFLEFKELNEALKATADIVCISKGEDKPRYKPYLICNQKDVVKYYEKRKKLTLQEIYRYKRITGKILSSDKVLKLNINSELDLLERFPNIQSLAILMYSDLSILKNFLTKRKTESLEKLIPSCLQSSDQKIYQAAKRVQSKKQAEHNLFEIAKNDQDLKTIFDLSTLIKEALNSKNEKIESAAILANSFSEADVDLLIELCDNSSDEELKTYARNYQGLQRLTIRYYLNYSGCNFDDEIKSIIKLCPKLRTFKLEIDKHGYDTPRYISDESIYFLATNCRHLRTLSLHDQKFISEDAICQLAQLCPELTNLDLGNCPKIKGKFMANLVKICPKLRVLNFSCLTSAFYDETLEGATEVIVSLANNCPNLRSLNLNYRKIYGYALIDLSKKCLYLRTISFKACDIGHGYIKQLSQNCRFLQNVNLSDTWINDDEIKDLSKNCRSLKSLYLYGCPHITDDIIPSLEQNCPYLDTLSISGTEISEAGVAYLKQIPYLRTLWHRYQFLENLFSRE